MWLGQPPYDGLRTIPVGSVGGQPRLGHPTRRALRMPSVPLISGNEPGASPMKNLSLIHATRGGRLLAAAAGVALVAGLVPALGASSGAADQPASVTVVHGIPSV